MVGYVLNSYYVPDIVPSSHALTHLILRRIHHHEKSGFEPSVCLQSLCHSDRPKIKDPISLENNPHIKFPTDLEGKAILQNAPEQTGNSPGLYMYHNCLTIPAQVFCLSREYGGL